MVFCYVNQRKQLSMVWPNIQCLWLWVSWLQIDLNGKLYVKYWIKCYFILFSLWFCLWIWFYLNWFSYHSLVLCQMYYYFWFGFTYRGIWVNLFGDSNSYQNNTLTQRERLFSSQVKSNCTCSFPTNNFSKGCDTGFGNKLAKRLAKEGYHVFAGCLIPEGSGAQELKREFPKDVTVFPLDVTKDESVSIARKLVQMSLKNRGLIKNGLIIEINLYFICSRVVVSGQ